MSVKVVPKASSPRGVVGHARKFDSNFSGRFDRVWCVVDVDQFDVADAVAAASDAGHSIAVSNPCFELWLLLHLQECSAHLTNCPEADRRLVKCLPGYDKTCLAFADFAEGVELAIERARRLEPTGMSYQRNPSTGVWRLVAEIRGDGQIP